MRWFTKITTDEYNSFGEWLLKEDGLVFKVLFVASCRAARKHNVFTGLKENEFYLSENEYDKFGLKPSQRGKIRRAILKLLRVKIIEKVESKVGRKNATIYRLNKGLFSFLDYQTESETIFKQRANREQIENKQRQNKNDKNDKNNILYNGEGKPSPRDPKEKKETTLQRVVNHYFAIRDYTDPVWIKTNYPRHVRPAQRLLKLAGADEVLKTLDKAARYFRDKELDWTLDTVVRWWNEIRKYEPKKKIRYV